MTTDAISRTSETIPIRRAGRPKPSDALIRSLLDCVMRRLDDDDDVTVEAVSRDLGYTRQYVSGRFHKSTGRLLSDFLKERKLEKAAKLLKTGDNKVSEVASLCGFDSENYFRQQFRLRFGMSPRQFRASGSLKNIPKTRASELF